MGSDLRRGVHTCPTQLATSYKVGVLSKSCQDFLHCDHCITSHKVVGSIPDGVFKIFH